MQIYKIEMRLFDYKVGFEDVFSSTKMQLQPTSQDAWTIYLYTTSTNIRFKSST